MNKQQTPNSFRYNHIRPGKMKTSTTPQLRLGDLECLKRPSAWAIKSSFVSFTRNTNHVPLTHVWYGNQAHRNRKLKLLWVI